MRLTRNASEIGASVYASAMITTAKGRTVTLIPARWLIACLALVPAVLSAQAPTGGSRTATRSELESTAQTLERAAASPAYSARTRARARDELVLVRRRLAEGDLSVGERVAIRIEGQSPILTDTLTVLDSLIIDLPGIRRVRLYGVLLSELEPRIAAEVGEVIRNARVSARPLMRVAVLGAVSSPGFRAVPAETLVDQLLSLAGSPMPQAIMDEMSLMRADTVLMGGPAILSAIADGRSIGSLGLRNGDVLMVPQGGPPWDRNATLQIVSLFLAPIITIFLIR